MPARALRHKARPLLLGTGRAPAQGVLAGRVLPWFIPDGFPSTICRARR